MEDLLLQNDAPIQYLCGFLDPFSLFRFVKACQGSSTLRNVVSIKSVFLPRLIGGADDHGNEKEIKVLSVRANVDYKLPFLQTFHHRLRLTERIPQEKLMRQFLRLEDDDDERKPAWGLGRPRLQNEDAATATTTAARGKSQVGDDELLSLVFVLQHVVFLMRDGVFLFRNIGGKRNVRLIDVWHTLHGLGFRSVPDFEPVFTFFDCIQRKHIATLSDMAHFCQDGDAVLCDEVTPERFKQFQGMCQSCIDLLCDSNHDWTQRELIKTELDARRDRMDFELLGEFQVKENDHESDNEEVGRDYGSYKALITHIGELEYTEELFPDISTLSFDWKTFQALVNEMLSSCDTLVSPSALCFLQKAFEDMVSPSDVIQARVNIDGRMFQVTTLVGNNGSVAVRGVLDGVPYRWHDAPGRCGRRR